MTSFKLGALTAVLMAAGCGGDATDTDAFTNNLADMTVKLFKLQSGTYKVTDLRGLNDACMVNPNDAANPTIGKTFTLTNDGAGNIGFGTVGGTPPEASNGSSCPGSPANPACATATSALPFNNNMGTLVRDNDIDDTATGGTCFEHRHVENLLVLSADNAFTSSYLRTDTKHVGCTITTDCTTTWTWDFVKQ